MKSGLRPSFATAFSTALFVAGLATTSSAGTFLDLTSAVAGDQGSFNGTLGAVSVSGSVSTANGLFFVGNVLNDNGFDSTEINNSSKQYSYGGLYNPSIPLTDQVGYDYFSGATSPATITITFSSAIVNPIFHIANLDASYIDFSPTPGLAGLVLLSGNGGGGDGIKVLGNVISDANLATGVGQTSDEIPLTSGDRSAYGSVLLSGSFTSLVINWYESSADGDAGNFTLSTSQGVITPEPATLASGAVGLLLSTLALASRSRRSA